LGLALLLIQSREATWDLLLDGWGADIAATDRAMQALFDRCAIDPGRVGFGGFSDGASYALSLALSNGELVRRVIAFSPGFERGARRDPKPRVFISHGTADRILPIGLTGRRIAERLEEAGYDVTFLEFEGGHEVPPAVSRAAFDWLAR
ncbi:MAG: hypothetical protein GWM90_27785, partial [Gemmatimonadetes bacterium]|nr:hypothetical protein [Gemmatimonadota bacterium]NIU78981.1 hypothetical protein [Gammaproteobacteria bacterium]NIQ58810.1 hypothetical protein [Gemmatimonadota bacterium]NIW35910.1 hypothetical protein [Gemmatimonadota bacterium]NIX47730.1 hypothetical protein [Gemmatimonadota bacterium]